MIGIAGDLSEQRIRPYSSSQTDLSHVPVHRLYDAGFELTVT